MSMVWHELEIDLEPPAHEAVAYALMEAGALGTVTTTQADKVTGYFAEVPDRELIRSELLEALRIYELPSSSVRDMNLREVSDAENVDGRGIVH